MERANISSERRIFSRVAATFPVELKFKDPVTNGVSNLQGETFNLSEGGLGVALKGRLPISSSVVLRIDPSPRHPPIQAEAQVIWNDPLPKKVRVRCGVCFSMIEDEALAVLRQILCAFKKKVFVYKKTVYLSDTNAEGNVYFARYFDWQGVAREEFYRQHFPISVWQSGIKLITVNAQTEYKHEAFLFDEILIDIKITNVRKMSLELIFTYKNEKTGQLIAIGREKLAFGDPSGKLIPIPQEIRENTKYFLAEEADAKMETLE